MRDNPRASRTGVNRHDDKGRNEDQLDAAIAAVPQTIDATQVTFTVVSDDGSHKPVMVALPKNLTHDDLLTGVLPAVIQIGAKVIADQKPKFPLTLVHGALPNAHRG